MLQEILIYKIDTTIKKYCRQGQPKQGFIVKITFLDINNREAMMESFIMFDPGWLVGDKIILDTDFENKWGPQFKIPTKHQLSNYKSIQNKDKDDELPF